MRSRFDMELEKLNTELIRMGALCEDAMEYAVRAVFEKDNSLVERAEEAEREIDRMERNIETLCMRLLLRQQPVAKDLRMISSALKMISDMERIGDQAADIAEIVQYVDEGEIPNPHHLKNMSAFASSMLSASINAFVQKDEEAARKVILDDDVVDSYFERVKADLIEEIEKGGFAKKVSEEASEKALSSQDGTEKEVGENGGRGQFLLDILMIAKYIERVGDHATNIAEWVVYGLTGMHPEETN